MTFSELSLIEPILTALEKKGYKHPTPIQNKAIPHILAGRDVLGCAQTGTGKTAAFAIPILQILDKNIPSQKRSISTLILTPTRELAIQIEENIVDYGASLKSSYCVIFGGVSQQQQTQKLRKGVDILIATPGRLLDLHQQGFIDLRHIKQFVLDEADRMLDMGFIHDVKKIIQLIPKIRQTLFFSATMPKTIQQLANSILNNPVTVTVAPVSSATEKVEQRLYFSEKEAKKDTLIRLVNESNCDSVLVFTRTKHGADKVARFLNKEKISAAAIHGNKTQNARQKALNDFKDGKTKVLVATDIVARGIDIIELELVVNYEIPNIAETYVHRIGRTGRAGKTGLAISLCETTEKPYVKDIEKILGTKIPVFSL
ncbi:MAG: hypothetical protein RL037_569 [Bacteroidota bacterium]|jgi:ATP-dependent RNA helicase RhlE